MVSDDNRSVLKQGTARLKGPLKWGVIGVELTLVLILAYVAAGLVHQFLADSRPLPNVSASSLSTAESTEKEGVYLRFDPFFRAVAEVEVQPDQNTALPESNLQMDVFGLRAERGGGGAAIVKLQDGDQKLVKVGENLAPGARLTGVYKDRLELNRGGRREAVYLTPEAARSPVVQQRAMPSTQKITKVRTPVPPVRRPEAASGVQKILQELKNLGLKPVRRNRRIIGFRMPEDLPQVAQLLGFEAGDILLSVNGEPVNSFERFAELEEELASARQLNVEIERRGEVRRVPVSSLGS